MTEAIKSGPLNYRYGENKEHDVTGCLIDTPNGDRWHVERQGDYIAVAWSAETSSTRTLQETLRVDTSTRLTLDYCDPYDHSGEVDEEGMTVIIGGGWHEGVEVDDVLEKGDEEVVAWALSTDSAYYYYGGDVEFPETPCLGFNMSEGSLSLGALKSLVSATARPSIVERFGELIEMSRISQ